MNRLTAKCILKCFLECHQWRTTTTTWQTKTRCRLKPPYFAAFTANFEKNLITCKFVIAMLYAVLPVMSRREPVTFIQPMSVASSKTPTRSYWLVGTKRRRTSRFSARMRTLTLRAESLGFTTTISRTSFGRRSAKDTNCRLIGESESRDDKVC